MQTFIIKGKRLKNWKTFHAEFKKEMHFPDYYGENNGKIELKVKNQPMISDGTVAATLNYKFEPLKEILTLEILEKTKFMFGMVEASDKQIWEGFDGLVEECQKHN